MVGLNEIVKILNDVVNKETQIIKQQDPVIYHDACFQPPSNCILTIADEISRAKENIFAQFRIDSKPKTLSKLIIDSFIAASKRGVKVYLILSSNIYEPENKERLKMLESAGIKIFSNPKFDSGDNKIMVIDKMTVLTGYIFIPAGDNDSKLANISIVKDSNLARKYLDHWYSLITSNF